MPSEDSTCAVCDDSEGENSNAIVFCDGCNLAVHQGGSWDINKNHLLLLTRQLRLLWRSLHSRRTMALQEMYGFSGKSCCKFNLYVSSIDRCLYPPQSCVLCPNEGGAFKQTVTGGWVHLLCAIWVPETRVANEVFMEPITGVDKISKQRWKLVRLCVHFWSGSDFPRFGRSAVCAISREVHAYNVPKLLASPHFIQHARVKRSCSCL